MTPSETNLFKALVAVAWADGKFTEPEQGMIEALLWAFGASEEEEAELKEYSTKKRTLAEIPANEFLAGEKETLVAHAALLTHADGKQTAGEQKVLAGLVKQLGLTPEEAKPIIANARERAAKLASKL